MRFLMILPTYPFPADNGQRLRFANLALFLAAEHEVALVCISEPDRRHVGGERDSFLDLRIIPRTKRSRMETLLSSGPSEVTEFKSEEMSRAVTEFVARYDPDVVVSGDPVLTQYLGQLSDRVRILDYVCETSLQMERFKNRAGASRRWIWALRKHRFASFMRKVSGSYDACILNSKEDMDSLLETSPHWNRVIIVPNGLDLEAYPTELAKPEPGTMVYPGAVTYPPNLDAVRNMIDNILPRIRNRVADARFIVTGALPSGFEPPRGPGVRYTGYVPDVRPVIAGSWICAVPLRLGAGGTRFKVMEALALGTPIVSTAIGAEGVSVEDGKNILMAEDPGVFAEKTVRLLQSPELRTRIAREGRSLMEQKYDWRVLGRTIVELSGDLLRERRIASQDPRRVIVFE
ncbi:MAG: glycosyltransferase family 4 protein [Vicinamibacteria bacterium]